jgi:hypothetical protein
MVWMRALVTGDRSHFGPLYGKVSALLTPDFEHPPSVSMLLIPTSDDGIVVVMDIKEFVVMQKEWEERYDAQLQEIERLMELRLEEHRRSGRPGWFGHYLVREHPPEDVDPVHQRLERIDARLAGIGSDLSVVKEDVGQLKSDVTQLKGDVAQLKTDMGQVREALGQTATKVELEAVREEVKMMGDGYQATLKKLDFTSQLLTRFINAP